MSPIRNPLLELGRVLPHGSVLVLDAAQHLVERIRQHAQLVRADLGRPHGVVLPGGYGLGGFRQRQDGLRDRPLKNAGQEVRGKQGDGQDGQADDAGKAKRVVDRPEIRREVQRAKALAARHYHGLESDEQPTLEAVSIGPRHRRYGIAGHVRRIRGELTTALVVQDRGHDVRVDPEGGQELPGIRLVGKGQRGRAVRGNDPTADGQGVERSLPQGPVLVSRERGGREQQDQPADRHKHRGQLLLDRPVAQRHLSVPSA